MTNATLTASTIESLLSRRTQIEAELDAMGNPTVRDQRIVDRIKSLCDLNTRLALLGVAI